MFEFQPSNYGINDNLGAGRVIFAGHIGDRFFSTKTRVGAYEWKSHGLWRAMYRVSRKVVTAIKKSQPIS